jgi:hypothetical protein
MPGTTLIGVTEESEARRLVEVKTDQLDLSPEIAESVAKEDR